MAELKQYAAEPMAEVPEMKELIDKKMKEMAELKPCPFCGSTDIKFAAFDAEDEGSVLCMMCKKCEACGPIVDPTPNDADLEYQQAIDAWNKRS